MSSIDGKWDCISQTPMGDQPSVMELKSNGTAVTGTNTNMLGTIEITNGKLEGNVFTWQMEMTSPFPMKMSGEVVIDGDSLEGKVAAGFFGKSGIVGKRQAEGG